MINFLIAKYLKSFSKEIKMPEVQLELSKIKFDPSPNKSKRNSKVNCIILHHTGPGTFDGIKSWLKNKDSSVSAHYLIGSKKDETVCLVKPEEKAWHAGKSRVTMGGKIVENLNENSVGIEICNIGLIEKGADGKYYYEVGRNVKEYVGEIKEGQIVYSDGNVVKGYYAPYTLEQIDNVVVLCKALIKKYPDIKKENIFTHYWVGQPVGRKNDPFGLDVVALINKIFAQ